MADSHDIPDRPICWKKKKKKSEIFLHSRGVVRCSLRAEIAAFDQTRCLVIENFWDFASGLHEQCLGPTICTPNPGLLQLCSKECKIAKVPTSWFRHMVVILATQTGKFVGKSRQQSHVTDVGLAPPWSKTVQWVTYACLTKTVSDYWSTGTSFQKILCVESC